MFLYLSLIAGLAASLFGRLDGTQVATWWGAMTAIIMTSHWLQRRYAADPERGQRAAWWSRIFIASTTVNGVALGLGALLFFDPRLGPDAMVPLVFVVTFTVTSSHAKTAIPRCAYAMFLPALGLAVIAVVFRSESSHGFLVVFLLALAVFGVGFTRSSHRLQAEALRLDHANTELLDKLRRARDEAEAASQAKSAFLAVVSHEVRTPLNAMMGMTELLTDAPLDDSHRRRLDTLRAAGDHILGLIEDMLDFSRIEAGQVTLSPKPFDLRGLASETIELFREQALRKGIVLDYAVDDGGSPYRLGDSRRMRQVLVNLLHNAIKYTDIGHVRLTIEAGGDSTVLCTVEDEGPGIPPNRREAIFEPFLRGGEDDGEGAGLGLAICRRLVSLMGGRLWLEAPERGSRFRFTAALPAVDRPPLAIEPAAAPATFLGRLLVADDSEYGREMMAAMAAGFPLVVDLAADGEQAVAKAANQRYDLILMDMRMPGLDGPQALAAIRRHEAERGLAPVPVAAMTAGIAGKTRADVIAAGFADYLLKPFSRKSLGELLARYLRTGEGGGLAPASLSRDSGVMARCRDDVTALKAAIVADDLAEAGHLAHRLKGLAMLFGMRAVAEAAEAIEAAAMADGAERLGLLAAKLEGAVAAERRRLEPSRPARRAIGPARVLLVDDHEMVRDGLKGVLAGLPDFEIVAEAADGLGCIRMLMRVHPDLVLIDLAMPRMNGAEAVPEIRKRAPAARVVMLTGAASPALMRAAADCGADALVRKDLSADELVRTLRAVLTGEKLHQPEQCGPDDPLGALSRRERQVLKLIVEGRRTRDIADMLGLSERTVEKHRANLGRKLGTSTPAELAALAVRHRLTADE